MFGCGKGFDHEVPFAGIPIVGEEPLPFIPVASTPWMDPPLLAGIHRYIRGSGVTSFETHLDEFSAIPLCYKDGGPQVRLVNERRPPELANVGQLRKVVQAVSGAWRRDELEDFEYFDGDFVSEVLRYLGLGPTSVSDYDARLISYTTHWCGVDRHIHLHNCVRPLETTTESQSQPLRPEGQVDESKEETEGLSLGPKYTRIWLQPKCVDRIQLQVRGLITSIFTVQAPGDEGPSSGTRHGCRRSEHHGAILISTVTRPAYIS